MKRQAERKRVAPAPQSNSARELAEHISAILNHPDTPTCIYNGLSDAVCELYTPPRYSDSVEYLTAHLAGDIGRGDARGD